MDVLPWVDLGIAVIIFTIIVKLILSPLSKASVLTQARMKELEPEINKIKTQYANDRQNQTLKIMALYKERKVRPFAGVLLLFIQLPILLALISVFYKIIPEINTQYLYSFVTVPIVETKFLGLIDLTQKSLILALITGLIQYAQIHFSIAMKSQKNAPAPMAGDMASQIAGSMGKQMKIMVPILAFVSTYWLIPMSFPQAASIIAIYWSTSSLFTLFHELYLGRKFLKK